MAVEAGAAFRRLPMVVRAPLLGLVVPLAIAGRLVAPFVVLGIPLLMALHDEVWAGLRVAGGAVAAVIAAAFALFTAQAGREIRQQARARAVDVDIVAGGVGCVLAILAAVFMLWMALAGHDLSA